MLALEILGYVAMTVFFPPAVFVFMLFCLCDPPPWLADAMRSARLRAAVIVGGLVVAVAMLSEIKRHEGHDACPVCGWWHCICPPKPSRAV